MRQIRLLLEYDGTAYSGWQTQRGGKTIQDIVRNRISEITGKQVRLTAASRTDAGVHALGQVAVFGTTSRLSAETLMRALNAGLPGDIRVREAAEADGHFHPRFDARGKRYVYVFSLDSPVSPFLFRYVWHHPRRLNVREMRKAAAHLLGRHDFTSFRGAGCGAKTAVRTVRAIDIRHKRRIDFIGIQIPGNFILIRIEADAFLRHMARNIAGTLAEVGKGRISPDEVRNILRSRDRTKAGPTAPSRGLFLEQIMY